MTDRLADLTGGVSFAEDVLESGHDEAEVPTNRESRDSAVQAAIDKFQDEADALAHEIGIVEKATLEVQGLFRESLATLAAGSEGSDDPRVAAESLCDATAARSQKVRARLRALGEENRAFKRDFPTNSGELRLRVTQHQSMARRFMAAMEEWEATNDAHREESKLRLEDKVRALRPDASEDEVKRAVRDGDESFLMQSQQRAATAAVEDLRQRTKDIQRLEESIVALHQLFVDMQIMVDAQGELLNEVEYEIGETRGQTENAHAELVQARAHQKSAQKKKCCIIMLVVLIVLAVAVGLIIKFAPQWVSAAKDKIQDTIGIGGGGGGASGGAPGNATQAANGTVTQSHSSGAHEPAGEVVQQLPWPPSQHDLRAPLNGSLLVDRILAQT